MDVNRNKKNGEIRRDVIPNERTAAKEEQLKFLIIGDFGVGRFSSNYKITIGADFTLKTVIWDDKTRINVQLWDIAGHERFGYMTRVYYKYAVGAAVVFDLTRSATIQSVTKVWKKLRKILRKFFGSLHQLEYTFHHFMLNAVDIFNNPDSARAEVEYGTLLEEVDAEHEWLEDLREKVTLADGTAVPVVLLANKCDVTGHVPIDLITRLCRQYNIDGWFPTSAKENFNIDKAFEFLITRALQTKVPDPISRESIKLKHRPIFDKKFYDKSERCCH